MTLPIILTEDGSITCKDEESGELYHNQAGAYNEALQHYVQLCDLINHANHHPNISVLDVCFGLGYNTFVFINQLIRHIENNEITNDHINCHFVGIDRDSEILSVLSEVLKDARFERLCQQLALSTSFIEFMISNWKKGIAYNVDFDGKTKLTITIDMKIDDIRRVVPQLAKTENHFDYIFHDGFSPRSMPELWTTDLFAQYTQMLNSEGRIITYSSATAVRGGLKENGLDIRKSAPLGRKSGGTIAFPPKNAEIVNGNSILFLNDDENVRLNSRSSTPYRDPHLNNTRAQITKQRAIEIDQSPLPVYDRND